MRSNALTVNTQCNNQNIPGKWENKVCHIWHPDQVDPSNIALENIVESIESGEVSETHINERRLLLRIDLRLLPCLVTMYLITFLDRVNIGNAAVLGMREDLGIVDGTKYNAALMIFFIPYVVFEIPSNIVLVKLKPHVWLSFGVFSFGLITIFQGLVTSWASLMVTRFFLGMFEAGLIPGCVYLLSMWYRRYEAQKRYTAFACSTILAGAFGGLLASALGKMDGIGGYGGWRWVFIIEGAATCLMAVIVFFALPDFPQDCKWLNQREFEFLRDRAARENGTLSPSARMRWRDILHVFKDWKIFIAALMFFGQVVSGYGYAYFAPTIIRTYGYGPIKTQLYSVPPWVAAFGCSLAVACLSDYFRHRYIFALISVLISISGYCVLLTLRETVHHNVQYFALFLVTCGCFSASPVYLCWFGMNLGGQTRRSVGTAFQLGIGNIGGIVGTYSFLEKDAPLYRNGYTIGLSFACFSAVMATVYFLGLWYQNRQRQRMLAEGVEVTAEEEEKLGDLACTYRYAY